MYICTFICIYTYIYIHICISICICMCICIWICRCISICICIYIYMCVYVYVHGYVDVYVYIYMYCMYTCMYMYVYIYIYIYIYICRFTRVFSIWLSWVTVVHASHFLAYCSFESLGSKPFSHVFYQHPLGINERVARPEQQRPTCLVKFVEYDPGLNIQKMWKIHGYLGNSSTIGEFSTSNG